MQVLNPEAKKAISSPQTPELASKRHYIYYVYMKAILLFLLGVIVFVGGGVWYMLQPKSLGISWEPLRTKNRQ